MSFNGSGVFTIDTVGNPVVADTDIDPTVHNATLDEIATGLSTALCRDGQSTVTANLSFNNFRLNNVSAGTQAKDAANLQNLVNNTGKYVGAPGGTVDVITLTPSPAVANYSAGLEFWFLAAGANTGAVTVNVSGLGAKSLTKNGATALAAGDLPSGALIGIMYDGTRFQKI